MQRYFIPPEQFGAMEATIAGDDAHHLIHVMRARTGDSIIVSNGLNREALAQIASIGKNAVTVKLVEDLPMNAEPKAQVWIAQSLPKGDKMELVIQKGTEVGAARFVPFLSARTVVQYDAKKEAKRLERWRKIAKEAAEQAHRNLIPEVDAPVSWSQLLALAKDADLALLCYEKESRQKLKTALKQAVEKRGGPEGMRILLAVGPEGGFTEQEAEEAERERFQIVGLGARILRTETAGIVGLTCILYETGEMGG
jgi:16S rRNA (uracil1498-N3)-methyltransferase